RGVVMGVDDQRVRGRLGRLELAEYVERASPAKQPPQRPAADLELVDHRGGRQRPTHERRGAAGGGRSRGEGAGETDRKPVGPVDPLGLEANVRAALLE